MKKIFRPDIDNLLGEWLDQPDMMHVLARNAAEKRNDMDVAKADMELIEAELKVSITKNPEKFGFDSKPAQPVIDAKVTSHRKFQKAQRLYHKTKLEHSLAEAALSGASTKKAALENLVIIWNREQGALPKMKKEIAEKTRNKLRENEFKKLFSLKKDD